MKYNKYFIITLATIYSSSVLSITLDSTASSYLIKSEYEYPTNESLINKSSHFTPSILNQIISDNILKISKNKNTYGIEINTNIAKDLEKYLRDRSLSEQADLLKENIIRTNGHINIQSNHTDFKTGIIDYLLKKSLLTESTKDDIINIINNKKTMIYRAQDSLLTLDDLNAPEKLNKIINNLNTKNSYLLLLEQNTKKDLNQLASLQTQDYSMLNNSISDTNSRLSETIEENKIIIKNQGNRLNNHKAIIDQNSQITEQNKTTIDTQSKLIENNRIDISNNADNIANNKNHIDDITKNYIDNLNINGNNLSLKNHFSTLYTEQSVIRSEFKNLKTNFEHFKSDTQSRFYKVEKRANQGIASVAAMSNLPFTDSATFSTAIGIGNYRNATALAWGMQYRINENIKVRASTAWNESNWVSAGGVGVSW
ncbi:YadA C-terminal domain-containing protein [Proteus sp. FME41]|uniref:YadA C-terminal domain-containing protein n=1 Tax=Proteus sp. FME41 TaxID=2742608 RepID=UPI001867538B|nr:YadA C-terminal domain-containing protein [Proteus sp. FME41]